MGVDFFVQKKNLRLDEIKAIMNTIQTDNAELKLTIYDKLPEEMLDPFLNSYKKATEEIDDQIRSYTREELTKDYSSQTVFIVVTKNNHLVGWIDAEVISSLCTVKSLFVEKNFRGKRIAKWLRGSLILHCDQFFTEAQKFQTNVASNNIAALIGIGSFNFRTKLGWHAISYADQELHGPKNDTSN